MKKIMIFFCIIALIIISIIFVVLVKNNNNIKYNFMTSEEMFKETRKLTTSEREKLCDEYIEKWLEEHEEERNSAALNVMLMVEESKFINGDEDTDSDEETSDSTIKSFNEVAEEYNLTPEELTRAIEERKSPEDFK